jgi:putative transcriptional regulator
MLKIKIDKVLEEKGRTKYWLIKEKELNFHTVTNLVKNKTTGIQFDTLEKICKTLDCTPNDIIEID